MILGGKDNHSKPNSENKKTKEASKHPNNLYTVLAQDMIGLAHSKEFFNTCFLLVKKLESIQIGDSCGI